MSVLKICPVCSTEYPANERFCPRDGTALRAQGGETNDLVGTIIADRYHIIRKLGEGGMGQVYLAEHVKMGRKSAVKVMNPGMVTNVDAISRFNREAANASRINHPNVAGIYDFGETPDGLIYLAMEFVEGQPLTDLIRSHGALMPDRASEIARQVAEGLSIAHDMGIVHRDLKPDNIMIGKGRGGSDLVKVVDFGIAKAAASDNQKVTKTGMVVGTPEYMSPEQLSGDPLDARSDIYSLGLVTFNMLTGKLPFPSDSMQETMIMRLTDKPKGLRDMKPDITWPADVQAVMDRVLERDADKRYRLASEFARDLVEAIARMPRPSITTMGTQVISPAAMTAAEAATAATLAVGAVPKTRVSKQEVVGRTAEDLGYRAVEHDAAAPAPRGAAQSGGSEPSRSRKGLLVATGALALVAVVSVVMMNKGSGTPGDQAVTPPATQLAGSNPPDSTHPGSSQAPGGAGLAQPTAGSGPATAVTPMNNALPQPGRRTSTVVNAELKALGEKAEDADLSKDAAEQIRADLKALGSDLQTPMQRVTAALTEVMVLDILDGADTRRACEALKRVSADAARTPAATAKLYDDALKAARCPAPE